MNSPAIIRQRRDTASAWTSANPILHSGQLGFELDTRKLKIGNGEDEWNDLPYVGTPLDATYLVKDSNGDLTAERVVGNSTSIVANWDTAGAVSFERAAFTGDVTASANDNALTIANSAVTFSKFQNSATAGLSVIGRNVASAGVFAEINAATDGHVLRRDGSNLGFGTIVTDGIANSAVTLAKIENLAANTVIGNATASAAAPTAISAATDGHVLRRAGSTLGFGTIATAGISDDAVTFSKFQNSATAGLSVIGRNTNSAGDFAEINAATDGHVLRRDGSNLGFGAIVTAGISDDAVTYAKIQNVSATDRLLGRSTAGAGIIEEITCTAAGRALLSGTDAAAQRETLSLGALATAAVPGTNTQVIFNSSGSLAGDAGLTYNSSTDKLTVSGGVVSGLLENSGTLNINSTAAMGGGGINMFSNLTSTGVGVLTIGTASTTSLLAVYGTFNSTSDGTIQGSLKLGTSNSGSIKDSSGNNKISFTSTDTTISGTGGITLTGNTIKSSSDTVLTLSENDATISGHITSNEGYRLGTSAVDAKTVTSYTLGIADNGKVLTFNSGSSVTVSVPTGLATNFTCTIVSLGTGKVTISPNASVTLNWYGGTGAVEIAGQYGAATLLRYGNNIFHVSGTLQ